MKKTTNDVKNVIIDGVKITGIMIASSVMGQIIYTGSEKFVDKTIESIISINNYINPVEYRKEKWYSIKKTAYNARTGKKIK